MKNIIGVINFLVFIVSKLVSDVGRGENIFKPGSSVAMLTLRKVNHRRQYTAQQAVIGTQCAHALAQSQSRCHKSQYPTGIRKGD